MSLEERLAEAIKEYRTILYHPDCNQRIDFHERVIADAERSPSVERLAEVRAEIKICKISTRMYRSWQRN